MVENGHHYQSRRRFLKRSGVAASGIIGGTGLRSTFTTRVAASGSDPHWTSSDQSRSTIPLAPPTPDGTHDRTTSLGSSLNYIATYWGEETSRNIHAFTYGAKGYQRLTDTNRIVYEGVVPESEVEKRPSLQAAAGGGRLHKIKYPIWGRSVSETVEPENYAVVNSEKRDATQRK